MTQGRSRSQAPGALASYQSDSALAAPTRFIATLKTEDGIGIPTAWISVHLDGSGLLRPEGAMTPGRSSSSGPMTSA